MKKYKPGNGIIVFLLFFGIALLDAIRSFNLLAILFWISMGIFFLMADNMHRKEN
ncbi:MAG TPA: hypothetical protein VGC29_05360 [Flavisolibacter sp.]